MPTIDSSRVLSMRAAFVEQSSALQKAAGIGSANPLGGAGESQKAGAFGDVFQSALAKVNELQENSSAVTESYERGETTDIAAVMLARQQASVGFEATLQVRNKLLSAYKDIMSMPV
ncbi:flagellar hook-basal body complex protein FliE [Allosphingosinicella flava]|uniref:Flagellar hook-basal body complex protein FliE n=1 Tax=Allosphingosinicella flava TaxID=2771430 RepID=A0A7T2GK51_9SPHN|nr:flagellar hook-basal body complex protein FliE [Sphingosinicella flava]QPQ55350.1 flagellar hook-basal body complex protein FliE [Sphingosinicella flava]